MLESFQYSVDLREDIKKRIFFDLSPKDFLHKLNYKNTDISMRDIEFLLSDPFFLINKQQDISFNPIWLLIMLTKLCRLDMHKTKLAIQEIKKFISAYDRCRPYLFIQTEFITTQDIPLHILSLFATQKKIIMQIEHFTTNLSKQIVFIQEVVDTYINQFGFSFPLWGQVIGYSFYYSNSILVEFTSTGKQINRYNRRAYEKL